jgi:hypothetical protein
MTRILFACQGGRVLLPQPPLVSRSDGGNLIVNPPRDVWERSELTAAELTSWGFLVAATAGAMLTTLPALDGGCVNYWEAGNWALHDDAEPRGPKTAPRHRSVHQHLLGRSRFASDPSWRWGEAPKFPDYADRMHWSKDFESLRPEECAEVVRALVTVLRDRYGMSPAQLSPWAVCHSCGYPAPLQATDRLCAECIRTGQEPAAALP